MATLPDLTSYLDEYLRIAEVPDASTALNGLQVENRGEIARLVAAVDASQATIDGVIDSLAAAPGPVLLLVHHGLFWDGLQPVTGR
ncbi:MAG: Nif3-like dinuclear metal center hexameric protein, partial [Gemmatimonadota bacterium]